MFPRAVARASELSARRPALPGRLRTACVRHASSSLSPEAIYEALKGVRHASSRLSPEAMDEAIKEMNAEMEDLFGTQTHHMDPRASGSQMEELFGSAPTADPHTGGGLPTPPVDDRIKAQRITTNRIKDHRIKDHRSGGQSRQDHGGHGSFSASELPIPGRSAAAPAVPLGALHSASSSQIERTCSHARGVLCGKIDALVTQLAGTEDAEQSRKLARGVAACAAALTEVVGLQVAADGGVVAAPPPAEGVDPIS